MALGEAIRGLERHLGCRPIRMRADAEEELLERLIGGLRSRDLARPEDHGVKDAASAERDGLSGPLGDGGVGRDDDDEGTLAAKQDARGRAIERPAEPLAARNSDIRP